MAEIIPFPKKEDFMRQFKGIIPEDIYNHMSAAYDRVKKLSNQAPSVELSVLPGYEDQAINFEENYSKYILTLLSRILELESELSLAKRKS